MGSISQDAIEIRDHLVSIYDNAYDFYFYLGLSEDGKNYNYKEKAFYSGGGVVLFGGTLHKTGEIGCE